MKIHTQNYMTNEKVKYPGVFTNDHGILFIIHREVNGPNGLMYEGVCLDTGIHTQWDASKIRPYKGMVQMENEFVST